MANKRFLGLGFTFSATDKGLENKLQGINSALQGISESLASINNQAGSAGTALGSMKAPGKVRLSSSSGSDMGALAGGLDNLNSTFKKGITRLVKRDDLIIAAIKSSKNRIVGKLGIISKDIGKAITSESKALSLLIEQMINSFSFSSHMGTKPQSKKKTTSLVPSNAMIDAAKLKLLQQIRDNTERTARGVEKGRVVKERITVKTQAAKEPQFRTVSKPFDTGLFEDVFQKLSSTSKKFISDIEKTLGSDLGKHFSKGMEHLRVEFDNMGHLSDVSTKRIGKFAEGIVETGEAVNKYKKSFNLVAKSFDFLRHWFHDIGSSVERFLSSVGVDLSTIIPEQFRALLGIAKSVLAPIGKGLVSLPKMLLSNVFKKEDSKVRSQMLDNLRAILSQSENLNKSVIPDMGNKINQGFDSMKSTIAPDRQIAVLKDISNKLGGRPSAAANVSSYLADISSNTKPEKKGMLGRVGDFFKNFAKMIPGFGMVSGLLSKFGGSLLNVVAIAGLALEAGAFLKGFIDVIMENSKVFKDFGTAVMHLASSIWNFASKRLSDAAQAVSQWADQFIKNHPIIGQMMDALKAVGSGVIDFGKQLGNMAKSLYETIPVQFRESIENVGLFIFDTIRDAMKMLADVFTDPIGVIKKSLGGLTSIGKGLGSVLVDTTSFVSDKIEQASKSVNQAISAPPAKPALGPERDLGALIQNQTDTHEQILLKQLQMMQKQNEYLDSILRENQKDKTLNANVKMIPGSSGDASIQLQALSLGVP